MQQLTWQPGGHSPGSCWYQEVSWDQAPGKSSTSLAMQNANDTLWERTQLQLTTLAAVIWLVETLQMVNYQIIVGVVYLYFLLLLLLLLFIFFLILNYINIINYRRPIASSTRGNNNNNSHFTKLHTTWFLDQKKFIQSSFFLFCFQVGENFAGWWLWPADAGKYILISRPGRKCQLPAWKDLPRKRWPRENWQKGKTTGISGSLASCKFATPRAGGGWKIQTQDGQWPGPPRVGAPCGRDLAKDRRP